MIVPRVFCFGVVVGCRIRIAWTWISRAEEFRSFDLSAEVDTLDPPTRMKGAYRMR
jgi:hypothetical protein